MTIWRSNGGWPEPTVPELDIVNEELEDGVCPDCEGTGILDCEPCDYCGGTGEA